MKVFNLKECHNSTRIFLALLITVGAFFTLSLGDRIFYANDQSLTNRILVYVIPFIYLLLLTGLLEKSNVLSIKDNKKDRFSTIKTFGVGLACAIIPILIFVFGIIIPFLNQPLPKDGLVMLFQLALLSFCIGLFEEGIFRGIIFKMLQLDSTKKSLWKSAWISSILFGLLHLGNLTIAPQRPIAVIAQIIYATLFGILFSALYAKYQSFLGIVLLHSLIDFLSFYPQIYHQTTSLASAAESDIRFIDGLISVGINLPSFLLGCLILHSVSKKMNTPN